MCALALFATGSAAGAAENDSTPNSQTPKPAKKPLKSRKPAEPGRTEAAAPPTVIKTASCSLGAVRTAVEQVAEGAFGSRASTVAPSTVIAIAAGDCDWGTGQLDLPAGIALRGAGKNATIIRRSGVVPESRYLVAFDCRNGRQASFSGMTLVGNGNPIWDKGLGLLNGCVDFSVFSSRFTKFTFAAVEIKGSIRQRGVVYDNDFIDNYSSEVRNLGYGVVVYADGSWPALELGTENAVFVEDNLMSGNRHHIASNNSARYVFRHNKVIANDLTKDYAMTDAHGLSSSPRGSRSWEIYNNNFSARLTRGRVYAAIGLRGGDGVIFNNTISADIANPIMLEVEGGTCGMYPAADQIRDAWIWNNTPGTINTKCPASLQRQRDYYAVARPGYKPFTYPHPLRAAQDRYASR